MTLRGSSMVLPTSLQLWPPTVTAAVWKALEDRAALIARGSSRIVSEATARVRLHCVYCTLYISEKLWACLSGLRGQFAMQR